MISVSLVRRAVVLTAGAVGLITATTIGTAQTSLRPERFTALAVNTTGAGGTALIEIAINRWSTDLERDRLISVLMEKGPEKLLDALREMPRLGFIRNVESIGYDLHFARRAPLPEGGERVILITDRPIGFWEAAHQPRSIDYPFTVVELRVNAEGEGEGKLSLATKITADKESHLIVLENYAFQPVLLQGVKRERTSN